MLRNIPQTFCNLEKYILKLGNEDPLPTSFAAVRYMSDRLNKNIL